FDDSALFFDRTLPPLRVTGSLNRHLLASVHLSPRGHLSMCPQRAASLFTLTSSRRFSPVAYGNSGYRHLKTVTELLPVLFRHSLRRFGALSSAWFDTSDDFCCPEKENFRECTE